MDFEVKILDDDGLIEFQGGTAPQRQSDRFTSAEFTFETFVVGPSNKLAHAASMAVAEHPAQNYNPLLIYGDSGLGKTHLLNAIANVIRRNDPKAKIVYVKGDDFINEFIELIRAGRGSEFRAKYRQADLLLVDDVQFVAGKDQVQNEFFHTFNTLYESGRQIVLTSDRPPSEMTLLDDRLRTRFEWGLLADVKPPDFETRLAIVKNKAALLGMELPDKIAVYVAQNVTANVRQLEGTINKILAYKDLLGNETDEEVVTRAMKDILKDSNEYIPTPESILSYVSRYYNVDESVVRGQQRNRDAVTARQIAMYLIRSMTSLSQENIGRYFDNRDHATVAYSLTQVEKKMKKDSAFAEVVKELKTNINSRH
jgi:chromosomal replication initiator protein